MLWFKHRHDVLLALLMMCMSVAALSGCSRKEKVLDIETPAGNIEVNRSTGSGKAEVDINVDRQ